MSAVIRFESLESWLN